MLGLVKVHGFVGKEKMQQVLVARQGICFNVNARQELYLLSLVRVCYVSTNGASLAPFLLLEHALVVYLRTNWIQ